MSSNSHLRCVALCLGFTCVIGAAGCQEGPKFEPVHFTSQEWTFKGAKGRTLNSEHYVLNTTCKSQPFVDALPGFLETCWAAYEKAIPAVSEARHCETYLFGTRRQWEQFTEEFTPSRADTYKRIRSGGYTERAITVSHYDTQRSTLSVLAHEGLHQYVELTRGNDIPAWLNEGLACYFESFDLTQENRPIFRPEANTLRLPGLREALVDKSLISIREILGTHAGIEIQKRQSHVRNYYSQEWALILFLMQPEKKNKYHNGFQQLLADLGGEVMARRARALIAADTDGNLSTGEAVFRSYISDDIDSFQREYEQFVRQLLEMRG